MSDCLFCKIIAREIPAEIIYENDHILAFKDINPKAPVHLLIVPKKHYDTLNDIPDNEMEIIVDIHRTLKYLASKHGVAESGYRTIVNTNKEAGQEVFHLHYHLIGGCQLPV